MDIQKIETIELSQYAPDFWHRAEWINYCIDSSFSKGENKSIIMTDKNKIIAVVPLIQEGEQFTFQGSYGPCVLCEDYKYLGTIADVLKRYAMVNDIRRIAIDGFIPGFKQHVKQICISDLSNNQIRKSYKSLMKNNNNQFTMDIIDKESADVGGQVDVIKLFYYSVAKKVTRPDITFEYYKDWIVKGLMFLITMRYDNILVGFSLVTHCQKEAYYFMSAVLPEYKGHLMQGVIFDLLKGKGITDYILGDMVGEEASEKEKAISFYKSGFGNPYRYKVVSEYLFD